MSMMKTSKIIGPSVWKGSDIANDPSWIYTITDAERDGLAQMLAKFERSQLVFPQITLDDISIGPLAKTLDAITNDLEQGRGFALLRGLPLDDYSDEQIQQVYFAIGLYMGEPVKQNPKGDLLGLVMNVGDITKKDTRVYETNLYLPYHTDPSDVVGLLCIRKAKHGGMSSLVSAAMIYNRIIEEHPHLLSLYYRPFCYAHLGTDKMSPIFSFHEDKLSCRYLRQYIELGYEQMGIPLSRIEIEALDVFDDIMMRPDMRVDMMMEKGDIQFANNYAVLHSRTAFKDYEDHSLRRKKLRLWLKMPEARKLAGDFPGRNGFS